MLRSGLKISSTEQFWSAGRSNIIKKSCKRKYFVVFKNNFQYIDGNNSFQYKVEVKAALPSSSTYDYNVLTTTFDQCKASQGILTTMFTRTVYGKIDAKDVPKCPFKKVKYCYWKSHFKQEFQGISTMSNILITDDFIPTVPKMIFPDGKAKFIVKSLLYGKIASSKKLVTLFNWEVIGTVAK